MFKSSIVNAELSSANALACSSLSSAQSSNKITRKSLKSSTALLLVTVAFGFGASTDLHAQQQIWDTDPAQEVSGGSGDWDDVNTNWRVNELGTHIQYNGTGNPPPTAIFDITGGTVNVVGDKNIGNLTVEVNDYVFEGDRLIVAPAGSVLEVDSISDDVIFNNVIAGTGDITKVGNGEVILNADNTNTGFLTINQGVIENNGTIAGSALVEVEGGFENTGTLVGDLDNFGIVIAEGNIGGTVTNNGGGNAGQFRLTGDLDVGGNFNNNSDSATALTVDTGLTLTANSLQSTAGTIINRGNLIAPVNMSDGAFINESTGRVEGDITIDGGAFTNNAGGTIVGDIDNADGDTGIFTSEGIITGDLITVNTPSLSGTINGNVTTGGDNALLISQDLDVSGVFENNSTSDDAITLNAGANFSVATLNNNAGNVVANGNIEGNINNLGDGNITVGPTGQVTGNIENSGTGRVTVNNGIVIGNINNTGELELSGRLEGDLTSDSETDIIAALTVTGLIDSDLNVSNTGTLNAEGGVTGNVNVAGADETGGTLNLTGPLNGNLTSAGLSTISGDVTGNVTNNGGGAFGRLAIDGDTTISGTLENNSTSLSAVTVAEGQTLSAGSVVINAGITNNQGTITAPITINAGELNNAEDAEVNGAIAIVAGRLSNSGTVDAVENQVDGEFINNAGGEAGSLTNFGDVNNLGTVASLQNEGGIFANDGTISGDAVNNSGVINNSGAINGAVNVNGGTFDQNIGGSVAGLTSVATGAEVTNAGSFGDVNNQGNFINEAGGSAATFENSGTASNAGTIASVNNTTGNFTNSGIVSGDVENLSGDVESTGIISGNVESAGGTILNSGSIAGTVDVSGGAFNQDAGGSVVGQATISGGTVENAGTFGAVDNQAGGTFTNLAGATAGAIENAGTATNAGTLASLANTDGTFSSSGAITGNATNRGGTFDNSGSIAGTVDVSGGAFNQAAGGSVVGQTTISGGTVENAGAFGAVDNQAGGTFTNLVGATAGAVENTGTATNAGTLASLSNTDGTFSSSGAITGNATNSGGTFDNSGSIAGALDVSGGAFNQAAGGSVVGQTTISGGTVENAGAFGGVENQAGGSFTNLANGNVEELENAGISRNQGTINTLSNTAGTFANSGAVSGAVNLTGGVFNNASTGTVAGDLDVAGDATLNNSGSLNDVTVQSGATFDNLAGATTGAVENSGTTTNEGSIASLSNLAGIFSNLSEIIGNVTSSGGTLENTGTIGGNFDLLSGDFTQDAGGSILGQTTISGNTTLTNEGSLAGVTNLANGNLINRLGGNIGVVTNSGITTNAGTIAGFQNNGGSLDNAGNISGDLVSAIGSINNTGSIGGDVDLIGGTLANSGTISGLVNNRENATFTSTGTVEGGLINSGTANIEGVLNGNVDNNEGASFRLIGITQANGIFTNRGTLDTGGWQISGLQVFNNAGVINVNGIADIGTEQFNSLAGNNVNLGDGVADDVLNISGNFSQAGTLTFDIDSVTQTADRINVGGVATVGGPVDVNLLQGGVVSETIFLTAQGGIIDNGVSIGTITGLNNPLAETSLTLVNANELAFKIAINTKKGGFNRNQTDLQDHVNKGGSNNILNEILAIASAEDTADALDRFGGEIFLNQELATLHSADNFTDDLASCETNATAVISDGYGNCAWIAPVGGEFERDRTFENVGYTSSFAGVAGGLEKEIRNNLVVGLGVAYENRTLENQVNHTSTADQFNLGASIATQRGKWHLSAAVAGGIAQVETQRNIVVGSLVTTNTSEHDITWAGSQLRAEYMAKQNNDLYFKPSVELETTYLDSDGFTESGEASSILSVQGSDSLVTVLTPALEVGKDFVLKNEMNVRAFAKVGRELSTPDENVKSARFANAPAAADGFNIITETDSAVTTFEAGVSLFSVGKTAVQVGYEGRYNSNITQHGGYLKGNFKF